MGDHKSYPQTVTDDLNRVARENLTGIRVIRAYHAEQFQQEKFERVNDSLTSTNLFANRVTALLMPTMTFVTSGISLAIYWIGAYLLKGAELAERLALFSDMVVFSQYAMQVLMAFAMMTVLFVMLPGVMVSVRRINEVLDTEVKIQNGAKRGKRTENGSCVEFRHVSFRYPEAGTVTCGGRKIQKNYLYERICDKIKNRKMRRETLTCTGVMASKETVKKGLCSYDKH